VRKGDDASQSQAVLFISRSSIFILIAYRLDPEHKEVLTMLTPQTKLLKNKKTLTAVLTTLTPQSKRPNKVPDACTPKLEAMDWNYSKKQMHSSFG
jgi:hypothetical protein